jgi:CubicO group peptidase (beta-lactamase class C family)
MRRRMIAPAISTVCAALIIAMVLSGRVAAQNPLGDPNAEPAPFNPQMSALMSMLIQPRHAKLGLAGKDENWPLAGYALKELRQGFLVTARAVPRWKGLPVPDLFEAAIWAPLTLTDFAIKATEPRQFAEAYGRLTAGCNACHATTDHAFVVIKAPDASAFPNQEFKPKR